MTCAAELSRVRALSNEQLLLGLNGLLSRSRRFTALIVAHLGEVEERRLHLLAGASSLFSYCVTRLGMSEDEAYRRIEVAKLARRFPRLFEMLTAGQVSLSVAALLKPYATVTITSRCSLPYPERRCERHARCWPGGSLAPTFHLRSASCPLRAAYGRRRRRRTLLPMMLPLASCR
jgi:hypothetical protein